MARVLIYEDQEWDLVRRYSHLTKEHEVYVNLKLGFNRESILERLEEKGFDPSKIDISGGDDPLPEWGNEFDVYFFDGLDGWWHPILLNLKFPKDKTFINSGDYRILEDAVKEGYQILEIDSNEEIRKIVERV